MHQQIFQQNDVHINESYFIFVINSVHVIVISPHLYITMKNVRRPGGHSLVNNFYYTNSRFQLRIQLHEFTISRSQIIDFNLNSCEFEIVVMQYRISQLVVRRDGVVIFEHKYVP